MTNKIQELKRKRLSFLFHLYETTGGNQNGIVKMWDLGDELGFSKDETRRAVEYLSKAGLLEHITFGGGISITHAGVVKVEDSYQEPEANGAVDYKNRLEAELRAVELILEELKSEYEKGAIDVGRYFRQKKEYEISRAELKQRLNNLPREERG